MRIKEIRVDVDIIKIDFAGNKKKSYVLGNKDFNLVIENNKIAINNKKQNRLIGIANKEDMVEPEKWDNLISDLTA